MVIFSVWLRRFFIVGVVVLPLSLRLRVMLMKVWLFWAGLGKLIALVTMRLMLLLTWVDGVYTTPLRTLKRLFISACAHWYPIVKELQHFFVAIARTVVNHDGSGGTTLHPTVWSTAVNLKRRRVHRAVRDVAWLPGPESLWTSVWRSTQRAEVTEDDIRVWPFSVGLLVKVSHFLATLRWPEGAHDLGVGGVSYLELLILCERWAGERLSA